MNQPDAELVILSHVCQTNAIPKCNTAQQYLQKYENISDTCRYLDLLVMGLVQAGINMC